MVVVVVFVVHGLVVGIGVVVSKLSSSWQVPVQLGTEISLNISRASLFEPLLDYLGS